MSKRQNSERKLSKGKISKAKYPKDNIQGQNIKTKYQKAKYRSCIISKDKLSNGQNIEFKTSKTQNVERKLLR